VRGSNVRLPSQTQIVRGCARTSGRENSTVMEPLETTVCCGQRGYTTCCDTAAEEALPSSSSSLPVGPEVIPPPTLLHVDSPNGWPECAGMYKIVQDEMPNGQAVWKRVGGETWLYSSPHGHLCQ